MEVFFVRRRPGGDRESETRGRSRGFYLNDPYKLFEVDERAVALKEARDKTLEQREREETRAAQEEDITRLQKFKEWAKKNVVAISGLAIGIAGLIKTIILRARKVVQKGAQKTSEFSKAVANLGKKLWPLLSPIFSIITQILTWGAKGLAFLATNLWILAIALAWFMYDQYKERRRKGRG